MAVCRTHKPEEPRCPIANQMSRLNWDPAYVKRREMMTKAPYNYVFSRRYDQRCPATDCRNVYEQCDSQYRPAGSLVNTETKLRFGEPFSTYDPKIPCVSTELIERSTYRGNEGHISKIDIDSSLTRPATQHPSDIKERGRLNERFGPIDLLPPTDIKYGPCSLYDNIVIENYARGGVSTRVAERNKQYVTNRQAHRAATDMGRVRPMTTAIIR